MNDHLEQIRNRINDDGLAITFQTMGQYRNMLLSFINQLMSEEDQEIKELENAVNDAEKKGNSWRRNQFMDLG